MSTHDHTQSREATTLTAHAKLTLTLRVTGVRDDGYHLIDAEMVSLALCDTITIAPAQEISLTVSGPFADGVPTDETNLIHRVLSRVQRTAAVHIDKHIPHGGGLGGGSSDAAAVLRWAHITDLALAASIGADVAFCVVGGRAHVTGIGEHVEPLTPIAQDITLVIPPLHVSTPAVYARWDDMGGPRGDHDNDLEPAALAVEPRLATWRDAIAESTGQRPHLAGSGATWFLYGHHDIAPGLDQKLAGARVVHTSTNIPG